MTTAVKEKPETAAEKARETSVQLDVHPRNDVAAGMVEVTVIVNNERRGSTLVLTSPREFAFRKEVAE